MTAKVSKTQLTILAMVAEHAPCGWGEVWSHYDAGPQPGHGAFRMMNFDRAADALKRKGLIIHEDDLEITDAGRKVLVK